MPHTLAVNSNLLAAMDDLSLLARCVVEGFLDGLHRSPFLGYSTEFSAYRAYTQGEQQCVQLEIDYERLRTNEPLDVALIAYLERRAAV